MKLEIETPTYLIDIGMLPLADIEETAEGGLRIGSLVTNSALARHARPPPLSDTVASDPGGSVDTASQQGYDRGESAPAHAVSVLL
jgi:FAD binding domain in molybdopterin dehydrogenase